MYVSQPPPPYVAAPMYAPQPAVVATPVVAQPVYVATPQPVVVDSGPHMSDGDACCLAACCGCCVGCCLAGMCS